ncbi:hypothetical protein HPP92_004720 [Vanilla planifolia]|uniref:TORTIFOLIA1-like protein 2 n=1 Tax=Vanilla planifolia TaxID=51239 RepID=A0A835RSM9_VANPL|nr:hypothetical protein HPP92_004720 [Vanilla planifolia]
MLCKMRTQPFNSKAKTGSRMITQQQAAFELKQRVVLSLNKLADRDTYQIGVAELEKTAENLTPEGIVPFLSCITDTDSEQKSAVRKECIRVIGTLARFHGRLMSAHLAKMVSSIVKRLKDSDSSVRDACIETSGVLTVSLACSGGGENAFVALVRPFFEALGEQNRYVQAGSAKCLARVIDEATEPFTSLLAEMLSQVVKAKPAIIELIRSIIQAGGASTEHALSLAVTSILEALKCSDWTTRKAAALALSGVAVSVGTVYGHLKNSCICSLESCRFDKVKPVRDAVVHALQCWKVLPACDNSESSEAESSSTKEILKGHYADLTSTSDGGCRKFSYRKPFSVSACNGDSSGSIRKRTPLAIRKNYPNIQDHTNKEIQKGWDIEASLAKSHSASSVDDSHKDQQPCCIQKEFKSNEDILRCQNAKHDYDTMDDKPDCSLSELISESCNTKHVTVNQFGSNFANSGPVSEEIDSEGFRALRRKSLDSSVTDLGFQGFCNYCSHANAELALIRKQLLDIETKQSKLLDLLEIFMGNTQGNLQTLQLKVHNLEGSLDHFAHIFVQDGSYANTTSFEHLKKNQSVFSSPRFSTCTPRSSVDANKPDSTSSVNKRVLCREKSISRCGSSNSAKEDKIVRNQVELFMQSAVGRIQAKENRNMLSLLNSDFDSKDMNFEKEAMSCKRKTDHSFAGDVESAYKEALSCGDDVSLLALMGRTGPVLDKLNLVEAEKVVNTLTSSSASLPEGHLTSLMGEQFYLYHEATSSIKENTGGFLCALKGIAEQECIDLEHQIFIAQVVARLSKEWGEAPTRRMPLPTRPNGSNNMK